MTDISGISDFLTQAGTEFRVFDLGRRIQQIPHETFLLFEQGESPYPYPLQQQAWLGIMVWQEDQSDDLVIWFVRFPLDASGKLTTTIRDDFLYRLIKKQESDSEEDTNPYGFKPKQEHMACFHAKAALILNQPASKFYAHAQDYFAGKPGYDQWAFVGFQGIADMAARLSENSNLACITIALPQLPTQSLDALCQCLEHEVIPDKLSDALAQRLTTELAANSINSNLISLLIRALSGSANNQLCSESIKQVLSSSVATDAEIIASISGRCWLYLKQQDMMQQFLENLAHCPEGQEFFNMVILDLVNIPGMQDSLNAAIRSSERSPQLAKAIGELLQNFS
ncbi:MAG: DUF3549 family protein [Gammaproteobacteria bacterium]|nr:DUF3549 family protein [Gammaproteobacteria bacterium]